MNDINDYLPAFFPWLSPALWHLVFEVLAYFCALRYFLYLRQRHATALGNQENMLVVLAGMAAGAVLGSKMLVWLQYPEFLWLHRADPDAWLAGKTIVGGLLGGWLGVEIAKRVQGIHERTGDLIVFPLILGIAIGRVGCFAAGLADDTSGIATDLLTGIDFGDGVRRHPTQLYEIAFLAALACLLARARARGVGGGRLYRWFMFAYLAFRFGIDFLKPPHGAIGDITTSQGSAYLYANDITAIQLASLIGLILCGATRNVRDKTQSPPGVASGD